MLQEIAASCATWRLNFSPKASNVKPPSSTKNSIWKFSEHPLSHGADPMPEEPQDKQQDLWTRVLQAVQEKVPAHSFDTWFPPIVFAGSRDDAFDLIVPNETFRRGLLENFSDILDDILSRIVAASCRLNISVQT